METIEYLFGVGKELNSLQMATRSVIVFILALLMLRIAGVRTLGRKSAFDTVVIIMLGAILSRAVVGSSPFIPTIVASFVLVLIHRLLGWISFKSESMNRLVNGKRELLYKDGKKYEENMQAAQISEDDVHEEVRAQFHQEDLENVKQVWLEKTGKLSIIETGQ